jgi:hypothetical protein
MPEVRPPLPPFTRETAIETIGTDAARVPWITPD